MKLSMGLGVGGKMGMAENQRTQGTAQVFMFDTLPETNIAPEDRPSQKETSIPTIHFLGQSVSFGEV